MKRIKTIIIIVGPTASGKTSLSLQLAAHYKTAIISADSRQCFKELNVGVAKPADEALQCIKHYFINSHSIHDVVNAQVFEHYALAAAEETLKENDIAIMVGGTGMYINAFCEGLDEIPQTNANLRNTIINNYKKNGLPWLQAEVQQKDPAFWKQAEQKNPQRLMRALEIITITGKSITHYHKQKPVTRPFIIKKIGIDLPKQQLHANIEARINHMINNGLVDEVRTLSAYKYMNALQTVGYKEIFNYLDGNISLDEAVAQIKTNTKQYAKRQLTWFRKYPEIQWSCADELLKTLRQYLG